MEVKQCLPLGIEEITMKKLIIWIKLFEHQDLSILLIWLGIVAASCPNNQVEQKINNLKDREEMKLAQLESYLMADDNQGIVDLTLYL